MDQATIYNVVTRENWIAELAPDVRQDVLSRMSLTTVPAGGEIARAGEPCNRMFQIESGYVRLSGLHVDGSEPLITIYIPGNCFAETALVARRPYNHSSIALVECQVRVLRDDDFWALYHQHPAIPESLCRKFAGAITRQILSREARATMKLGQRIAMMFHNFATFCAARTDENGIVIGFPITQHDIATLFDVTRQSVHRELTELRATDLIGKIGGNWVVKDIDRLRRHFA